MKSLSPKMMADPAVQHALQIRKAIREENYCRFVVDCIMNKVTQSFLTKELFQIFQII